MPRRDVSAGASALLYAVALPAFGSFRPLRADDTVGPACMEGRCLVSDSHLPTGLAPVPSPLKAADDRLIAALEGPDVDAALEKAMARLPAGRGNVQLLLSTIKVMVRSGLAGLAVRLLDSTRVPPAMQGQLRSLLDQLAHLPPGRRSFTDFSDRYRANARRLLAGQGHLRGVIPSDPPALDDLHLFITPQRNAQVVRDDPAGRLSFVFPFADHRRRAAALKLGPVREGAAILALGVPSVPLLKRLLSLRTASGYRPPIDIIEPDAEVLAIWLHLVDVPAAFDGVRVGVFAGLEAPRQYESFRAANLWRQEPTLTLKNHRPNWRADRAWEADGPLRLRVEGVVQARQRRLMEKQAAFYDDQSPESWAQRFRRAATGGPPLRVLALTTRYSTVTRHVMRDLAATLRRRGCEADIVCEPHECSSRIDTWSLLAEKPYDLVIVLNHLRNEIADRIHPNIPYVCWIQDYMPQLWTRQAGESLGPLDLVLGRDRGILTTLHGYPPERFVATGNLTDRHTYSNEPVAAADLAPYRCDVSYVSHGSATPDELIDEVAEQNGEHLGAYLRRILALMRPRLAETGWVSLIDTFDCMLQAEQACDDLTLTPAQRRANIHPVALCLVDRLLRHETLHWVADWAETRGRSFKLFGRGWERHPTLGRFACGEIENGHPLRCLAQASSINLQINAYSAHHQRLLDSLAAGGFVLTRYNPNDFIRPAMIRLQQTIHRRHIEGLDQLLRLAGHVPEVAGALDELRRLRQPILAPLRNSQRRREVQLMREVGDFPQDLLSDHMLFDSLRSQRYLPHRLAGDIPGFAQTTFNSRQSLHALLDRYVDDERARLALAGPMWRDVIAHDTYETIVDRIIDIFANPPGANG